VRQLLPVLFAGLSVLNGSCSAQPSAGPEKPLLGKWQTPTGGVMEFHPDGTITMSGPKGSVDVNYRFLDGQTFEITRRDGTGRPVQMRVESVTADELVLRTDDGPQRLRRAR
jgi:hypothetical protein